MAATHTIARIRTLVMVALVLSLWGCSAADRDRGESTASRFEYARLAMGSRVVIVVYGEREPISEVRKAFDVIDRYEQALSDYRAGGEAMRLAASPGIWHVASPELRDALGCARQAWSASEGALDVTVGPETALWREATAQNRVPTDAELAEARGAVGFELLEFDEAAGRVRFASRGMRLDFGAIGKGLAADRALRSLAEAGFPASLVGIGGDIAVGQSPPGTRGWIITAESERSTRDLDPLANRGVATSGDAFRFTVAGSDQRSHVVDPESGGPIESGASVTVVGPDAWRADALATIARLRGVSAAREAGERLGSDGVVIRVLDP